MEADAYWLGFMDVIEEAKRALLGARKEAEAVKLMAAGAKLAAEALEMVGPAPVPTRALGPRQLRAEDLGAFLAAPAERTGSNDVARVYGGKTRREAAERLQCEVREGRAAVEGIAARIEGAEQEGVVALKKACGPAFISGWQAGFIAGAEQVSMLHAGATGANPVASLLPKRDAPARPLKPDDFGALPTR